MKNQTNLKEITLITKEEKFLDPIDMIFYNDGAVAFSKDGGEHFIYLYPDIVEKVTKEFNKKRCIKNE